MDKKEKQIRYNKWKPYVKAMAMLLYFNVATSSIHAQVNAIVADLATIDGIEITPDNMFNYRINNQSSQTKQVEVNGRVVYRKSALSFTYKFNTTVQPGINNISRAVIPNPGFSFSEPGLKDLFMTYNKLPQGTYEYCVSIRTLGAGAESADVSDAACVYQTVEDMFLINLVTPENDAKIYEYNPMLAWVVNYPFASELTYKLRVAELKQGQNPQSAITRNNPVYKDDHVMTTGTIYPVTARPLQKWQPYVWTVDAYYKGILLGGAEVWKFTIIEDSVFKPGDVQISFIDISIEEGKIGYSTSKEIKLKYNEQNFIAQEFIIQYSKGDDVENWKDLAEWKIASGENYVTKNIEQLNFKHNEQFNVRIINKSDLSLVSVPAIKFKYINPIYVK
jgi:hypothetical protein